MKTGIKCRACVSVIVIAAISLIAVSIQVGWAAAMPSFSYRPHNGVAMTAADMSWRLQLSHEADFRMPFEGKDAKTPLIQLGQGIVWSAPATQVSLAATPPSDLTTETQTNPDGSTTTYRTERNPDGSSTTTVTKTNPDGSTQVTGTYRSEADGSWTSTETNPDGSTTTIHTRKNPAGSWTTTKTTTPPPAPAATPAPLSNWRIGLAYRISDPYDLPVMSGRQETLLRWGRDIVWSTPGQFLEGIIKEDAKAAGIPKPSEEIQKVEEKKPGFFESLIPALIPSIGIGVGRDRERRHPNPCAPR